jgi:hypothetical protein
MIKKILSILLLILFSKTYSQDTNKVIVDPEESEPMLIGYCTREALEDTAFSGWFNSNYDSYEPDSSALDELRGNIGNAGITLVIGTWCSDSREVIPGFFKVIDMLGYSSERIKMIAVDRDKKTEGDELEGLNAEYSPTIIFYRDSMELGRIVEFPEETIEQDMVRILSGKDQY